MKKVSLVTACLFLLISNISCLKKQNLDDNNLGPALDANELENVMLSGIGDLTWNDVRVNEKSVAVASRTYEDSQYIKILKQTIVVQSIVDTGINLLHSREDYLDNSESFKDQLFPINLSEGLQKSAAAPFFLVLSYFGFATDECRLKGVTCHNLHATATQISLDPQTADPSVCPSLQSCKINVQKVEFDVLYSTKSADGKPYRTHVTFIAAPRLPFFSKVLQYCVRGLVPYSDREVLAEDCWTLNGFSAGD